MRLGNNKRRLSADGTATPFRHPLASRSGADLSAHTWNEINQQANSLPLTKADLSNEQLHSKKPKFIHPANPSNQHKNNVTNSQMTAVCALGY